MGSYLLGDAGLSGKKRCIFYQDGEFGDNAMVGFNAAGVKFDTEVSYFSGQQVQPCIPEIRVRAQRRGGRRADDLAAVRRAHDPRRPVHGSRRRSQLAILSSAGRATT